MKVHRIVAKQLALSVGVLLSPAAHRITTVGGVRRDEGPIATIELLLCGDVRLLDELIAKRGRRTQTDLPLWSLTNRCFPVTQPAWMNLDGPSPRVLDLLDAEGRAICECSVTVCDRSHFGLRQALLTGPAEYAAGIAGELQPGYVLRGGDLFAKKRRRPVVVEREQDLNAYLKSPLVEPHLRREVARLQGTRIFDALADQS